MNKDTWTSEYADADNEEKLTNKEIDAQQTSSSMLNQKHRERSQYCAQVQSLLNPEETMATAIRLCQTKQQDLHCRQLYPKASRWWKYEALWQNSLRDTTHGSEKTQKATIKRQHISEVLFPKHETGTRQNTLKESKVRNRNDDSSQQKRKHGSNKRD